ncbi:MAG: sugar transferase [Clostridiaceae bacterium]|nr:sugar transferase [Clostridiaceae bacterium]
MTSTEKPRSFYARFLKRPLDIVFSLLGLLIAFPFILIAGIFIKIDSPGPVFFTQHRIGYKCKTFKLYKLRTMDTGEFDADGKKIRDRNRVTKVGRVIRKLSIDEFPQFLNILKGDMSFIGPRPLVLRYLPYYTDEELKRHDTRPGITGLAQVNGRAYLQWEDRFAYDLDYVRNVSFCMDVQIILKTIKSVVKKEGTSTIRPDGLVDFDVYRKDAKQR